MDCEENVGNESLVLIKQGAEAVSLYGGISVYVFCFLWKDQVFSVLSIEGV